MVRQLIRATLHAALASLCLHALAGPPAASTLAPPERTLPLAAIRSGLDYAGDDVKALQADPQANPGLLWLAEGQALWQQRDGAAPSCAGCHGANGQGNIGPSLVTADGPRSWTLAQFTTTLREGKTPDRELSATMPRFGEAQISDAQVADLQAYIKTLN